MANPPEERLERTDRIAPTRLLAGKYRLHELLGEGGMGAVYAAEHIGLGTQVAIKILSSMWGANPEVIARFRREARAAAAVRHENIVAVTDIDADEDGRPFMVMELLRGESVQALLGRQGRLPPTLAAAIVAEVLHGLAVAHAAKIVHRDLKPANMLIAQMPGGALRVKILDFGIAKVLEDGLHDITVTLAGAMVGTLRYMAPEQLGNNPSVDQRVDLYAVGVTLYTLTTGRLPFAGDTADDVSRLIREGIFQKPRELRPELPEALEQVILRAMATRREDRYPDATAFLADLGRAVPVVAGHYRLSVAGAAPEAVAGDPSEGVTDIPVPVGTATPHPAERTVAASPQALQAPATAHPPPPRAARPADRTARRAASRRALLAGGLVLAALASAGFWFWRHSRQPASAAAGAGIGALTPTRELRFGVAQYLPTDQIRDSYAPLTEYLSQRLGRPARLVIPEDYLDLDTRLGRGELDLVALSPYSYVRVKRKLPKLVLLATPVTSGGASYEGVILARAESGIAHLDDLKGKIFCYTNPSSTSGYLYPRALFKRVGIDPDRAFAATRFAGDHLTALRALSTGACDGAAVYSSILFDAKAHGIAPDTFRILATTERIPYDAYCTHPGVARDLVRSIQDALLSLTPGSEIAHQIFERHGGIIGFQKGRDSDYDGVRRIEHYLDEPPKK